MTRKLYYEDCHLTRFEAQVTGCEICSRGYEILLDATVHFSICTNSSSTDLVV